MIIQTNFQYSDLELVEQITEKPYLQYFIRLPRYQEKAPFDASTLVLFRKHISAEMLMKVNEYLLDRKNNGNNPPPPAGSAGSDDAPREDTNRGTLDATCAPPDYIN